MPKRGILNAKKEVFKMPIFWHLKCHKRQLGFMKSLIYVFQSRSFVSLILSKKDISNVSNNLVFIKKFKYEMFWGIYRLYLFFRLHISVSQTGFTTSPPPPHANN